MKAVLKLLLGSAGMAGAVAVVLTVQSVATYSPLVANLKRNVPHNTQREVVSQTRIYSVSVNPSLVNKLPYDTLADFTPVIVARVAPSVLVTRPTLPAGQRYACGAVPVGRMTCMAIIRRKTAPRSQRPPATATRFQTMS